MLFDGVHVPLTTPFYPDGRVYLRKLEHNVRRCSLTPVSGLIALGPNSESALLSDAEQRLVLETVAETALPEKVLIAGISQYGVAPALSLIEHAAQLRFDAALLQFPGSYAAEGSMPELLTWFRAIADRSPLPILFTGHVAGNDLPVAIIAELASHPNILGVLEQSIHFSRVAEIRRETEGVTHSVTTTITFTAATARMLEPKNTELPGSSGAFISAAVLSGGTAIAVPPEPPALKTRTKQVGFQILWGYASDAVEALRAGASGLAPSIAGSIPQAVFEIWAAWKDGDEALMRTKQARVKHAEPFFSQYGIAAVKAAAELSGYFGGRPRLPLLSLRSEEKEALAKLLHGMRS